MNESPTFSNWRRPGIEIDYACRIGSCGECEVKFAGKVREKSELYAGEFEFIALKKSGFPPKNRPLDGRKISELDKIPSEQGIISSKQGTANAKTPGTGNVAR